MTSTQCNIGKLEKRAGEIVMLTITCANKEINKSEMEEAVKAIDFIAEKPSPLLVDASQSHSISFDALTEMGRAKNVLAVAIYAPTDLSQGGAKYIELFQKKIGNAPYPFKVFSDFMTAEQWLNDFT